MLQRDAVRRLALRFAATFAAAFGLLPGSPAAQEIICPMDAPGANVGSTSGIDIDDGPVVRALLVFVKFRDDPRGDLGDWPAYADPTRLPLNALNILAPTQATITNAPGTLSRYFYEQSKTADGVPHMSVFGDVLPRNASMQSITYVTQFDNNRYHSNHPGGGGYGYLTKEILDHLVAQPGFDIANYDQNNDGVLDHLFLVIRSENQQRAYDNTNGPIRYSGCSSLDASQCGAPILSGRPVQDLTYFSPSRGTTVRVDWFESGSHTFTFSPANVVHPLYYVNVLAHEWGHELWLEDFPASAGYHENPVYANRVPVAQTGPQYGNLLMAGGGAPSVRWTGSLSARERDLLGWITPTLLGPAQSGQTVSLGDLYSTGQTIKIPVRGSTQNFVYLTNHQYGSYFEDIRTQPSQPAPYNTVAGGLFAPGISAMYTTDRSNADLLPADNTLEGVTICQNGSTLGQLTGQGCIEAPNPYLTDVFSPDAGRQLTPWTSPNINGCANYSTDPHCSLASGFAPSWQSIDDVRYAADGRTMQFEYYQDIRTQPFIAVRNNSRMGTETAGRTFQVVQVRDGARLTISDAITLTFTGDLIVEAGATLRLDPGVRLNFAPGARLRVHGTLDAADSQLAASGSGGWGGLYVGPGPTRQPPIVYPTSGGTTGTQLAPPPAATLAGVQITGVYFDPLQKSTTGALEVRDRRVVLTSFAAPGGVTRRTTIIGTSGGSGIFASGISQVVVQGESQITSNGTFGVYATAGARVFIADGTRVETNSAGGVRIDGYGTRADVDTRARVISNLNAGITSASQAYTRIRSTGAATAGDATSVSSNRGGPTAFSGGSVDGGQCTGYSGDVLRPNLFSNNQLNGYYDARAEGGSTVAARYAYWGGRTALTLIKDKSSTVDVFPVAPTALASDPNCASVETVGARGTNAGAQAELAVEEGGAMRGGPTTAAVVALASDARQLAWSGDPDGAFVLLTQAADASVTDDDRSAVFGAIGALVAAADTALTVPTLVASLEATSTAAGANEVWAQRALAVAYAVTDRAAQADAVAEGLTFGATEHSVFGHTVRVRLAVETDSLELSLDRLGAFAGIVTETDTLATEAFASSLSLVAAAFPDADLSGVSGGSAGRGVAGRSADGNALTTSQTLASREGYVNDVSVYPNPTASRGTVRVSVAEPAAGASVSVYDALGRRVAILHDGPMTAGRHDLALEADSFAPGIYVVQVRVTPETGAAWTEVRRVSVAR